MCRSVVCAVCDGLVERGAAVGRLSGIGQYFHLRARAQVDQVFRGLIGTKTRPGDTCDPVVTQPGIHTCLDGLVYGSIVLFVHELRTVVLDVNEVADREGYLRVREEPNDASAPAFRASAAAAK